MDELERVNDYEYGYDYLYEEKAPTSAPEDAEKPGEGDSDDESDDADGIENILAVEHIMQEVNVKPLDLDIPEDMHGMLKREAKAESLRRCEEAAQSPDDFMAVVATWDQLDKTRERRERYNEMLRSEETLEYGWSGTGLIFPQWMMDETYRQLSRGNFLNYLANCPYEMHNLTSKSYLRKIVAGMKEDHKEIFFFLYLRQYSPQRLAVLRGQTDRNIRKVRDVLLRKVRRKVYHELKRLSKCGYVMSDMERDFYQHYKEMEEENEKPL